MTPAPTPPAHQIDIEASAGFISWLRSNQISLAVTSYLSGEFFLIGSDPSGNLTVSNCGIPRCMGLSAGPKRLWVAGNNQIWRFENFLDPGATHDGHDALFVPIATHTTGALDTHDISEGPNDVPIFAATHFNCLARLTPGFSFGEVWRPPFIDRIEAGDRCHLNGMATLGGVPRYVSCLGATNEKGGWRTDRTTSGVVLEVPSGKVVAAGLNMPHSPRLYDGRLWLLQSGTGELGWIELKTGRFNPVSTLPGFARGLEIIGRSAVVGVSRPRKGSELEFIPTMGALEHSGRKPECAVHVVDIDTGDLLHRLTIGPDVDELYDVGVIPGITNPKLLRQNDESLSFFIKPLLV